MVFASKSVEGHATKDVIVYRILAYFFHFSTMYKSVRNGRNDWLNTQKLYFNIVQRRLSLRV
jgi:hypothetical protein